MITFSRPSQRLMKTFAQTTIQQPKPTTSKRSYAAFLEDFVDPIHSGSRSEPTHELVSGWLETDFGSNRKKYSQSDSALHRSSDGPVSRELTRSAPNMSYTRDTDGYIVPPTPPLSRSFTDGLQVGSQAGSQADSCAGSDVSGSGRSSGKRLVEDPYYRDTNLAANYIYLRSPYEEFPEHIASLVEAAGKDRDSPAPSPDQLRRDTELVALEMGAGEPDVEKYFGSNIFPSPKSTERLKRSDKQWIAKHAVPSTGSLRVSTPIPDMLYGYNRHWAFPEQQAQLISMGNEWNGAANSQSLMYPFLAIEFKGDGSSEVGSMWVATNQCLGGSTSCINIAERLNRQLRQCKSDQVRSINSAAFSVAMNGTEARLYISWKHSELDYYMRKIDSFLLQKPTDYLDFRKYVLNIIDWGKDTRLKEIRDSLNHLLEESRKRTSEAAKSRPPPSNGSATSGGKKRKPSSRGRSKGEQGHEDGTAEFHWQWDDTYQRFFHLGADGSITWAEEEEEEEEESSAS